MRIHALCLALLAACDLPAPTSALAPLRGGIVVVGADRGSPPVIDRMREWVPPMPDCVADAYGGMELTADVAPDPGDETVLVSFSQGVIVLGHDGHRIASTRGFDCTGSQDELAAVEVVQTFLAAPVIAVVATEGGRRESTTWLELVAVGTSARLDRLFLGEIERQDATGTHTGAVTLVPGGLVYRRPDGEVSAWDFDAKRHHYVERPTPGKRGSGYRTTDVVD